MKHILAPALGVLIVSSCGCGGAPEAAAPSPADSQSKQQQNISRIQSDSKMPPEAKAAALRAIQEGPPRSTANNR
jgi:hypothetical protein